MTNPNEISEHEAASSPSAPSNESIPAEKKGILQSLGPGLITGASDDDPSGIATYSQAGAQFGFGLLWTLLFCYPLMSCMQEISAQIGRVTGRGIAGNMRRYYPRWLLYIVVLSVLCANIINLGADIGAMGAAVKLLVGGSALLYAAGFAIVSLLLEIFVPYHTYARILKWLTASLFTYVATVFVVHIPWGEALRATVLPSFSFNAKFIIALVAVLGTTISPYLFFWQASEEVEEERTAKDKPLKQAPEQATRQLGRIHADTYVGMAFANLVAFFIMLTTAVTLNKHGITDIQTSAQAAEALRPVAGKFAFALFTVGIIGTGMLALPVLGGSAAYALGEALHWPVSLERRNLHLRGFYGIIAAATLIGLGLNFIRIDPIKALFWSAVINGVVSGPVMIVMMLMASNPKVMGPFTIKRGAKIMGWAATVVMLLAGAAIFVTWGK